MTNVPSGMATKSMVRGIELRADTAIQGLQTAMPAGVTQLTVGTVTYTLPDLVKYAQGLEQPWKDASGSGKRSDEDRVLHDVTEGSEPIACTQPFAFLSSLAC